MNEICKLSPETVGSIEKVERLEAEMRKGDTIHLTSTHHFAKGLYARELFIPKNCLLTGKIHKHEQFNIISKGSISVLTESGMQRFEAPYSFTSLPGAKRAGYAHEDTVWTTIIATDAAEGCDLDELERELVCDSLEDYRQYLITEGGILEVQHGVL